MLRATQMRPAVITDPTEVLIPAGKQVEVILKLLAILLLAGWLLSTLSIRS